MYDTLSEQEIALYEEYNDIEYALKAINPIISILSDIQTNVSVDNDHVLTSGLNNLNLNEELQETFTKLDWRRPVKHKPN